MIDIKMSQDIVNADTITLSFIGPQCPVIRCKCYFYENGFDLETVLYGNTNLPEEINLRPETRTVVSHERGRVGIYF